MEQQEQYKQAVEELTRRAQQYHPSALVLFTTADYLHYEIYGQDAIEVSKRLGSELLTGGQFAFLNCTRIPVKAYHVIVHIAKEQERCIFIHEPIKIHSTADCPMQGLFSLN